MAYIINKYNGDTLTTVNDGVLDTAHSSIKFFGKNYAGWGELQNENFLHLMEHFARSVEPNNSIIGQVWYDTGTNSLKLYDVNGLWKKLCNITTDSVVPVSPTSSVGNLWYNTSTKQLHVFDGTNYILVGPQSLAGYGVTEMVTRLVYDTGNAPHPIIAAVLNDETVFVINKDGPFELKNDLANTIAGFSVIQKGVTLSNTTDVNYPGKTTSDHRYWGTSSDSDRLGGTEYARFIQKTGAVFEDSVIFNSDGYYVTDETATPTSGLRVFNTQNIETATVQQLSDTGNLEIRVGTAIPLTISSSASYPGTDNLASLGKIDKKFSDVYAYTVHAALDGTASQSDTLQVGLAYLSGSVTSTPNTIVARDGSSDIFVNVMHGTATNAEYADLAENYASDKKYSVGTVVKVGGEAEITECTRGSVPIGVISDKPAFLMNSKLVGGLAVALKGRVPVRVVGPVIKGETLTAGIEGSAIVATGTDRIFAVALESSYDVGVKLVECVIL